MVEKWGKLFFCPVCHSQANADHNASVNTHHSFYHEMRLRTAREKAHRSRPVAACGQMGIACDAGTPRQRLAGQARSRKGARNAGGLSLIPKGHVPASMLELRVYLNCYPLGIGQER
jgi:hypothetical protein